MPNDNENVIPTTPDNALLKHQITVLRVIKYKFEVTNQKKIDLLWLDTDDFSELGLEPISNKSQFNAIESLTTDLWPIEIYQTDASQGEIVFDAKNKPLAGYTVNIKNIDTIQNLIDEKQAELKNISKVTISFIQTPDTSTIVVNGVELAFKSGEWKGRIIKALAEGGGEANHYDIVNETEDKLIKSTKRMITKNVGEINTEVSKHTGLKKLLFGQTVVKFSKNLYLIDIQKI